jgi:hypothetical protein
MGMDMRVRTFVVPALGGVPVVVRCSFTSSRMLVQEAVAGTATVPAIQTGLSISLLYPNSNTSNNPALEWTVGPPFIIPGGENLEPFLIAGYPGDHPPNTVPIGNGGSFPYPCAPGGPVTLGTPVFQVTSALAGVGTTIIVIENG